MVPQAAIMADQKGVYLLEVNPDNTVARHDVKLGDRVNESVVVQAGVEVGDRVIVKGLQKVRPGQTVKVRDVNAPPADAKAAAQKPAGG